MDRHLMCLRCDTVFRTSLARAKCPCCKVECQFLVRIDVDEREEFSPDQVLGLSGDDGPECYVEEGYLPAMPA